MKGMGTRQSPRTASSSAGSKDLGHQLSIYDLEGQKQRDVMIDGTVPISFERGDGEDKELYLDVDDRQHPARVECLDVETGRLQTLYTSKAPHDLADIDVKQVRATSRMALRSRSR
jgi:prolyl oligopeptidase PreP (S9A serine peptidase family)